MLQSFWYGRRIFADTNTLFLQFYERLLSLKMRKKNRSYSMGQFSRVFVFFIQKSPINQYILSDRKVKVSGWFTRKGSGLSPFDVLTSAVSTFICIKEKSPNAAAKPLWFRRGLLISYKTKTCWERNAHRRCRLSLFDLLTFGASTFISYKIKTCGRETLTAGGLNPFNLLVFDAGVFVSYKIKTCGRETLTAGGLSPFDLLIFDVGS